MIKMAEKSIRPGIETADQTPFAKLRQNVENAITEIRNETGDSFMHAYLPDLTRAHISKRSSAGILGQQYKIISKHLRIERVFVGSYENGPIGITEECLILNDNVVFPDGKIKSGKVVIEVTSK